MKKTLLKKFAVVAAATTMTMTCMCTAFANEGNNINVVNTQDKKIFPALFNVTHMIINEDFESYNMPSVAIKGQDYVATFEKVSGIRTSYSWTKCYSLFLICIRFGMDPRILKI